MAKRYRRRLFVDRKVQGIVFLRVISYWFFCLLSVTLMLVCWSIVQEPVASSRALLQLCWREFGPGLVASLLLLPLVLVDCLRVTNRFAGPMYRMRRAMHDLVEGRPVQPIHLRDGDFWKDFVDDFNRILPRLQAAATVTPTDEDEDSAAAPQPEEQARSAEPMMEA